MRSYPRTAFVNQFNYKNATAFFTNAFKRKAALNKQSLFSNFVLVCAAPPTSGDDINGQTKDCELLVVGNKLPRVVALGKVYQDTTTLHNIPLSPDVAKVTVEKVRFPDAHVPLPFRHSFLGPESSFDLCPNLM